MGSSVVLTLLVLLFTESYSSKKIPSYITLCHRSDPKLEECIIRAVEKIRPHLAEGIPELLLPPMNPLTLPEAGLNSGDNFKASFKNIEIYYANEFKIDRLKFGLDPIHIELALSFPRLRVKSQYTVDGRILVLQLQGQGPADGNLTDVSGDLVVDGYKHMKKGKEYIAMKGVTKLDLKLGRPVFKFDNIFRENKELNEQTNRVINDNVAELLEELRPVIDKAVTEFAFGIVNRIFNRFSFDELFPK